MRKSETPYRNVPTLRRDPPLRLFRQAGRTIVFVEIRDGKNFVCIQRLQSGGAHVER
jgi:hypothetical protein